jgi:hypothetical protein
MRREDPEGNVTRWARSLPRTVYRVAGPGSLMHIDGNHKLIEWRIVIHAAIDGFTRAVQFCRAAANNRAATVTALFESSVQVFPCSWLAAGVKRPPDVQCVGITCDRQELVLW